MPFPLSSSKAPRTPTVDDAAARLAERETHAATAKAELDAKRAVYNAAVGEASLTGSDLDTPAVERAHRELTRAIEHHERAQEAVRFAENEHAAAVAEKGRRDDAAQWDELERLVAARALAAKKFSDLAAKLAAARDDFLRAAQSVPAALPAAAKIGERFAVLKSQAAVDQARAELERVGVLPDPRRLLGFPVAKPLAEISAELCVMVKRMRSEPAPTPSEPGYADSRTMVRPVPGPEDVDRQPERAP